jgi:hypothetical protein
MRTLQESDIIRIMREEWRARQAILAEQIDMVMSSKIGKEEEPVLSPGLKVKHKKSNLRYTVASVGTQDIILMTPEGDQFLVDGPSFEEEYRLD